jgi:hypothetical protein
MNEIAKAQEFVDTHARLVDRRRFHMLFGAGDAAGVFAALGGHRNADGGFGWALEPDHRVPGSQPGAAMHAFEVFAEAGPATDPMAVALCDWLESASLPDGGIPFAVEPAAGPGTAPWWAHADTGRSSLHITSAVCAQALRVAAHDPAVAAHAWLARATAVCLDGIAALDGPRGAVEFQFLIGFLDAAADREPAAQSQLERLGAAIPADGAMPVTGGAEGETIRALAFAPLPDRPVRALFDPQVIDAELDRLAGEQHDDGGWDVDHATSSPASALEWRGYATVHALSVLRANGRL